MGMNARTRAAWGRARGWLALCVGVVALSACGGGGGGGADAGISPPPAGAASLIPVAPAPGAVLQADAATLRPLAIGHLWRYRGVSVVQGNASPAYTTDVTIAPSGGAWTESATNANNEGAASHGVALEGGSVVVTEQFDFAGKGPGETVRMTQLRSPVRVDDQWTILERRFADTAIDVDGDKRTDAVDVAMYARVIGEESVTLPRMAAVKAVRVDTKLLVRVVPSSTGTPGEVTTLEISDWYAPGIGLVQERTRAPLPNSTVLRETTEVLLGYDIGSDGGGIALYRSAQVPATAQSMAGELLPEADKIVAVGEVGNEVLLFQQSSASTASDLIVSRLDRNGRVLDTLRHTGLSRNGVVPPMLHASGAVVLGRAENRPAEEVQLLSFDARGALSATRPTINLRSSSDFPDQVVQFGPVSATTDGRIVWLLWERAGPFGTAPTLVLRGFDMNGAPTDREVRLEGSATSQQRLAMSGRYVMATWKRRNPVSGFDQQLAAIEPNSLSGTLTTIASDLSAFPNYATDYGFFNQVTGTTLAWVRGLGSASDLPGVGMLRVSGGMMPLRATTGPLDTELVAGLPPTGSMSQLAGRGQRIFHMQVVRGAPWSDMASEATTLLKLSWVDAEERPLSQTPVRSVELLPDRADMPSTMVALSDRVLGFSGVTQLRTTVMWVPKEAR